MWKNKVANLIEKITLKAAKLLSPFVTKEFLEEWKPIHLCWWFIKHNLPIPQYFIGSSSAPTVTDSAATAILELSATGNGNVTSDGGATITARGFVYSVTATNSNPLIGGTGVTTTTVSGTTGAFTGPLSSLTLNTGYSYKAYATNSKGTSYGTVQTFTTANLPTVALNTPADTATGQTTTPTLNFTGTNPDGETVEYNVQIDTVNTFNSQQQIIDSYDTVPNTNVDCYTGTTTEVSQAFTGNGGVVDTVRFYIGKLGTPPGNIKALIYNETHTTAFGTDSKPTGAALASSDTQVATNLSTSLGWVTFQFSGANKITLANGTHYTVTIQYTGGGDFSNKVIVGVVNPGSDDGNYAIFLGSWFTGATIDAAFYVLAAPTPLLSKFSATDAGFTAGHPFASGVAKDFTVQAGDTLANSTTYYWHVAAKDSPENSAYGAYSTTRSFTTVAAVASIPNDIVQLNQSVKRAAYW